MNELTTQEEDLMLESGLEDYREQKLEMEKERNKELEDD